MYYEPDHRAGEFIHFVFRTTIGPDAAIIADPGEVPEHSFYAPDALPEPTSPSTRRRVLDALAGPALELPIKLPPRSEE